MVMVQIQDLHMDSGFIYFVMQCRYSQLLLCFGNTNSYSISVTCQVMAGSRYVMMMGEL